MTPKFLIGKIVMVKSYEHLHLPGRYYVTRSPKKGSIGKVVDIIHSGEVIYVLESLNKRYYGPDWRLAYSESQLKRIGWLTRILLKFGLI